MMNAKLLRALIRTSYLVVAGSVAGSSAVAGVAVLEEPVGAGTTQAGAETRRPVTAADYGKWERLGFDAALSPDGAWLAAPIARVDGTSELRLHKVGLGGAAGGTTASGEPMVVAEGGAPRFSDDSAWLAFRIGHSENERERLQEQKEPIRNALGLVELRAAGPDADPTRFEAVAGFAFGGGGRWLAMHRYAPEGSERRGADLLVRDLETGADLHFGNVGEYAWQEEGSLLAMTIDAESRTGNGVQLWDAASGVLRVLDSGEADFRGLAWREDADDLAVYRSREDDARQDPTHLVLAWRDLAFGATGAAAEPEAAFTFDPATVAGFPDDLRVVGHRGLQWSDDGASLFFGIREWERKPAGEEADSEQDQGEQDEGGQDEGGQDEGGQDEGGEEPAEEDEIEPADVEVWHSFDERIIPMQKVEKERDLRRSYLAVWHLDDDRFVRLGTDLMETATVLEGQRHAVETDRTPYRFDNMFDRSRHDVWLIDVHSGERRKVIEGTWYFRGGSSTGRWLLWFADDGYWTYDVESGQRRRITERLAGRFVNDEYDTPVRQQRPPWGDGGWAENDEAVLLYDRYDVWAVRPDGGGGQRLTAGEDEEVRHRVLRLDRDAEFIDIDAPVYLGLYGEWTKKYGFARLLPGAAVGNADPNETADAAATAGDDDSDATAGSDTPGATAGHDGPASRSGNETLDRMAGDDDARGVLSGVAAPDRVERLVFLDQNVGRLAKADDAEVYVWVAQDFDDSPDLFAAGPTLADARQVTRTNPFAEEFAWGRSELVDYESATGERLQGALYYPTAWEPGRRFPMIVYVYEKLSQGVHSYEVPSERDPYNPAVWTSRGYFVLTPDIVFRGRDPGVSAVECVVPAVEKVLATRNVDADRVGLVGHSWGGYEASFIPTQTDVFAAAVAGAPLTNFFSMFGTVHWNQGMPESSHFETGQARMEVPYWEDMQAYVRNSPVMFVNELQTPMLVFFGDEDGTVDWHQGVELYNYARRAGKHLVMLVYRGENHSARRKPNQIDYHRRVLEWFDHFLKGEPAAPWITDGVTVLERDREIEGRKAPRR